MVIRVNDKIKWRTKNTGFAIGTITEILDDGLFRVQKTTTATGRYTANAYRIQEYKIVEVNGEPYEPATSASQD